MSCIVHQYWSTQRICLADRSGYPLKVEHFIAVPGAVSLPERRTTTQSCDPGPLLTWSVTSAASSSTGFGSPFSSRKSTSATGANRAQTVSFGLLQDCLVGPTLWPKQVETTWSKSQKIGIALQDGAASHGVGRARKEGSSWKELICRSALRTACFACKLKCSQNHTYPDYWLFHRCPNRSDIIRDEDSGLTVRGREYVFGAPSAIRSESDQRPLGGHPERTVGGISSGKLKQWPGPTPHG